MNRKGYGIVGVERGRKNVRPTRWPRVRRGPKVQWKMVVVIGHRRQRKPTGVALDIIEACPVYGSDGAVMGSGDYADSANSAS